MMAFAWVAVVPYALFVKFVALRGVENLSETVPGDYYFIRDASVSLVHILSWDLAGIMDKINFGDYLAKVPRVSNIIYTVILLVPFAVPWVRRSLVPTRRHRQLLGVILLNVGFAVWATVGYGEPTGSRRSTGRWQQPRVAAYVSSTRRQPDARGLLHDRPGAPIPPSLPADPVHARPAADGDVAGVGHRSADGAPCVAGRPTAADRKCRPRRAGRHRRRARHHVLRADPLQREVPVRSTARGTSTTSSRPTRSGNSPRSSSALEDLPQGKTVVLPPTETAKLVVGADDVAHKFIDKFYIYYLDQPSFYYGLTGDKQNKFEFFLLLRACTTSRTGG